MSEEKARMADMIGKDEKKKKKTNDKGELKEADYITKDGSRFRQNISVIHFFVRRGDGKQNLA